MKRIIFICIGLLLPLVSFAAGIQASPERLDFVGKETKQIVVANPTPDVQLFEVYPDDFEQAFVIDPKSFTLEAGGRKKVSVIVDSGKLNGIASTSVSILGKPLAESRVKVNTGIKIPVTVSGSGETKISWILIVAGAVLVLIVFGLYFIFRRKKVSNQQ